MSRTRSEGPHGVLLIDKPAGPSSAEIVDWARWALGGQPVGHFGTLDPAATGLLVLGVGWATRLTAFLTEQDKGYHAVFALGSATETDDAEGTVIERVEVPANVRALAGATLAGMLGPLELAPPRFSAVKVAGERAYAKARAGVEVVLETRPMTVHRIEDLRVDEDAASVEATLLVSKGTYVRSLAVELGRRLGVPAHLRRLRRVSSGALRLDDPRVISGFSIEVLPASRHGKPRHRLRWTDVAAEREPQREGLLGRLIPLPEVVPFPVRRVRDDARARELLQAMAHGRAISAGDPGWLDPAPSGARWGVTNENGAPFFVAHADGSAVHPERTILPLRDVRNAHDAVLPAAVPDTGSRPLP